MNNTDNIPPKGSRSVTLEETIEIYRGIARLEKQKEEETRAKILKVLEEHETVYEHYETIADRYVHNFHYEDVADAIIKELTDEIGDFHLARIMSDTGYIPTLRDLEEYYGEPVLVFQPLFFSAKNRRVVPAEIAVFNYDKLRGGYIVYSRYDGSSNWNPNEGQGFVLDHLNQKLTS